MGTILMLSVGAIFAGLFMGGRELLPYLAARRTGVIVRPGARDIRVRRDENAESFERLLARRGNGAAAGFGLAVAGAVVISLFVLAMSGFSGPFAILIVLVYLGFGMFASICLVRGFSSGRMFAFFGFMLFGEATRQQNPIWFWIYTLLNCWVVLACVATVLRAI